MKLRTKQTLAVGAGCLVAGVMVGLGVWQMGSYEESTRDVSAERAALPPESLAEQIADDGQIADIFGRRVTLSGTYDANYEVLVGQAPPLRVATLLRMDDGRYVTVVRGTVEDGAGPAAPPSGQQDVMGIFLSSDLTATDAPAAGADLGTVRLQELAQGWPAPLVGGYVTLDAAGSAAQGLGEASLLLPEVGGSPTHRGYALQWWVFAVGAIAFGVYSARGFAVDAARAEARRTRAAEAVEASEAPVGDESVAQA